MGISLKGIIGAVAPVLASALPGPLGGMARKVVADALGTGSSDAEIEKALAAASPDKLLALKAAEQAFTVKMEELGIDLEKIAAEDRSSARAMQIQTRAKAPGVIAAFVLTAWTAVMAALVFQAMPSANKDAIMLLIGALTASVTAVVQFYFGSSAGSRSKEDIIRTLKN